MRTITIIIASLTLAACGKPDRSADGSGGGNQRVVLQNKGSDTLVNVAQAWAENYKDVNSNVAIAVSGGGSGTGISAMINGTVDIANSSRKMKKKEHAAAEKNGISPVEHVVGYDALAVFLHPDNPIKEMTISQINAIYAEGGAFNSWSDLGITVPGCPSGEIVRVSRQNNSGTYAYFKKVVIGKGGEYKLGSRDMHGSKDVVDLVEKTPCAIGYSGLAYATDHIATPCVKKTDEAACVTPTMEAAADGSYPIARPLLMYVTQKASAPTLAYMEWIKSDKGQCIIAKKGYAPIKDVSCS